MLVRLILALAIVLGLIFGSVWLLRRYAPGRFGRATTLPVPLEVVGQTWLGQRRSVTALRVADRLLLLGVTPTSVTFLSEIQNAFPDGTMPRNAAAPALPAGTLAVSTTPSPRDTGARPAGPVAATTGGFGAELADILGGISRSRARLTGEDLK